jgi:hypothetical protein
MLNLSCLCGQVRIRIAAHPDYLHDCNCTLCRKTGARWGYFDPVQVSVSGATSGYCRADKPDPAAEIQFCATCGATTHFTLTATAVAQFGNGPIGVNMWLADTRDLAGIELRFPDGQAWSGGSDFGYVRPPRILGQD